MCCESIGAQKCSSGPLDLKNLLNFYSYYNLENAVVDQHRQKESILELVETATYNTVPTARWFCKRNKARGKGEPQHTLLPLSHL